MLYNGDYDVFQGCTKQGWKPFHSFDATSSCPNSGLVGHWKLDESGNVSTAADVTVQVML